MNDINVVGGVVSKPWGYEMLLHKAQHYKIKLITVNDGQRFSLQHHVHRDETWYFLEGTAIVTTEDRNYADSRQVTIYEPRQFCMIKKGLIHRVEAWRSTVMFLEVQHGECLDYDITRWEDDYGRASV